MLDQVLREKSCCSWSMFRCVLAIVLLLLPGYGGAAAMAAPIRNGELFYARYSGTPNVKKVTFDFDGSVFSLGSPVAVASTGAADGILFAPDGDLIVGGQGRAVYKVSVNSGAVSSVDPGVSVYHVMLDPDETRVWGASIPGDLAEIPLSPFSDGTAHDVTGDDGVITHLAFVPGENGEFTVFYTSSGSGGGGSFGTIDLDSFVTTRILDGLPAAHGMAYDSFTGDLVLMGSTHVTQIDPAKALSDPANAIVSDRDFNGVQGVFPGFDQGTVDGEGHLFVASGTGHLLFVDYSSSGLVGDASNFVAIPFLDSNLDDVAPLSGPGSQPLARRSSPTQPAAELVMPFDVTEGKTSFLQVSNLAGTSPGASQVTTHWTFWAESCDELADFSICLTLNDTVVVDPRNIRAIGPANEELGPSINLDGKKGLVTVTAYTTDRACSDFGRSGGRLRDDAIVGSFTMADIAVGYSFGADALGFGTDLPARPTRVVLPSSASGSRFFLQTFDPASVQASVAVLAHLRSFDAGPVEPVANPLVLSTTFIDNVEVAVSLPDVTVRCVDFVPLAGGLIPESVTIGSSGLLVLRPTSGLEEEDALFGILGQAVGPYGAVSSLKSATD